MWFQIILLLAPILFGVRGHQCFTPLQSLRAIDYWVQSGHSEQNVDYTSWIAVSGFTTAGYVGSIFDFESFDCETPPPSYSLEYRPIAEGDRCTLTLTCAMTGLPVATGAKQLVSECRDPTIVMFHGLQGHADDAGVTTEQLGEIIGSWGCGCSLPYVLSMEVAGGICVCPNETHCATCTGSASNVQCLTCEQGYVGPDANGKCNKPTCLVPLCDRCDIGNLYRCALCLPSTVSSNGICCNVSNCLACSSASQCTFCNTGFAVQPNGKCASIYISGSAGQTTVIGTGTAVAPGVIAYRFPSGAVINAGGGSIIAYQPVEFVGAASIYGTVTFASVSIFGASKISLFGANVLMTGALNMTHGTELSCTTSTSVTMLSIALNEATLTIPSRNSLTATGDAQFNAPMLVIDLTDNAPVVVNGHLTASGNLTVVLGGELSFGQQQILFTFASMSGEFTSASFSVRTTSTSVRQLLAGSTSDYKLSCGSSKCAVVNTASATSATTTTSSSGDSNPLSNTPPAPGVADTKTQILSWALGSIGTVVLAGLGIAAGLARTGCCRKRNENGVEKFIREFYHSRHVAPTRRQIEDGFELHGKINDSDAEWKRIFRGLIKSDVIEWEKDVSAPLLPLDDDMVELKAEYTWRTGEFRKAWDLHAGDKLATANELAVLSTDDRFLSAFNITSYLTKKKTTVSNLQTGSTGGSSSSGSHSSGYSSSN